MTMMFKSTKYVELQWYLLWETSLTFATTFLPSRFYFFFNDLISMKHTDICTLIILPSGCNPVSTLQKNTGLEHYFHKTWTSQSRTVFGHSHRQTEPQTHWQITARKWPLLHNIIDKRKWTYKLTDRQTHKQNLLARLHSFRPKEDWSESYI